MKLGTRGSPLALAQAGWVADRLAGAEIVEVRTGLGAADKSRWVDGLERALLAGEIDLAVHSAKDVPAETAAGLVVAGITEREDPRDALLGATSLAALPAGARVGTTSLRRQAAVLAERPDVAVAELRGNVDTRLRKLRDGEVDAAILALAGLRRLSLHEGATPLGFVPAAGQGALLLEARAGDASALHAAGLITDPNAFAAVSAERACVAALGATCATSVGAYAERIGDELRLTAWVGAPDGSGWTRDVLSASAVDPAGLGARVAERLLQAGAAELLAVA